MRSHQYIMNISAVSSNNYTSSAASTATTSRTQIEKQITVLQRKIASESASNDDAATKAQKIQAWQAQVATLQAQLTLASS